jgi:hypothetical protein
MSTTEGRSEISVTAIEPTVVCTGEGANSLLAFEI